MKISKIVFTLGLILLTGCKVGPNYIPPMPNLPDSYSEDNPGRTYVIPDEDFCHWWTVFEDPFLDQLLEESICGSFDYRIALEKVRQARSQYWVQFTQLLPELVGDALATRFRRSETVDNGIGIPPDILPVTVRPTPIKNFYQIGIDAIWEIDLWGKYQRAAEAYYDTWEASAEDARGVKITVLSTVASTYATINAYQKKIDIQQEFIELDEELIKYTLAKLESGLASAINVEDLIAIQELDKADLTVLKTAMYQNIYSLAVFLGRNPEDLLVYFCEPHPIPYALSMIVPAGLPADLLRRRPDIAGAERRLAAATEQIGIAVADLFPSVSLAGSSSNFASNPLQGANIGYASNKLKDLFKPESRVWGIGAFVQWPLLDFGQRLATIKIQRSLAYETYLTYQKTVITALTETEDALLAYFNEEERLINLTRRSAANLKTLALTEDLFQAGLTDYPQLIQSRKIWLASQSTLIDSQQAIAIDLIGIYKSMGGDW